MGAAPTSAAKAPLATPQITSVVAVDTRTATVTWTPVKGAHPYVLEWARAVRLSTSETTATVADLSRATTSGAAASGASPTTPVTTP